MKRICLATVAGCALVAAIAGVAPRHASAQEVAADNFVQALNCYQPGGIVTERPNPHPVVATFWIPSDEQTGLALSVDELWIDLSLSNNNFAAGTFIGAGPFEVEDGTSQFDWLDLVPGRRHYYRLNALTDAGWREVGRGVFDTPDCGTILQVRCNPSDSTVSVLFRIDHAPMLEGSRPVEQWLDISLFNNGFASGTFLGTGPFPAEAGIISPPALPVFFRWDGILSARVHFWRTNVLYEPSRWVTDRRGSVLTPDCRGLPSPAPPPLT